MSYVLAKTNILDLNKNLVSMKSKEDPLLIPQKNRSILLVEDNIIIQKVHKYMLSKMGYEIDIVGNGAETLKIFSSKYQLILMDIDLPDISGIEVTRQIRQLAIGKSVTIIALTAYSIDEYLNEDQVIGLDGFITKPVTQEKLCSLLNQVFEGNVVGLWL